MSLASNSSETIEVIIKVGMVTDSDMRMHHVLIILTLIYLEFKVTQILIMKIINV